jgi:hypothetical protein
MDLNFWAAGKNYLKGEYTKVWHIRNLQVFPEWCFRTSAGQRSDAIPVKTRRTHGGSEDEYRERIEGAGRQCVFQALLWDSVFLFI